jgi:hypothetical protein
MIRHTYVSLAALVIMAMCPTVAAAADAACVKRLYHAGNTITEVPLVFADGARSLGLFVVRLDWDVGDWLVLRRVERRHLGLGRTEAG